MHNSLVRLPSTKGENRQIYERVESELTATQNSLCEQRVPNVILPLLRQLANSEPLVKECFNVLYLVYKNNSGRLPRAFVETLVRAVTPMKFVSEVIAHQEEAFFTCVKSVVHNVADLLKEKRLLLSLHQRAQRESKRMDGGGRSTRRRPNGSAVTSSSRKHSAKVSPSTEMTAVGSASASLRRSIEKLGGRQRIWDVTVGKVNRLKESSTTTTKTTEESTTAAGMHLKIDFLTDYSMTALTLRTIRSLCDLEFSAVRYYCVA